MTYSITYSIPYIGLFITFLTLGYFENSEYLTKKSFIPKLSLIIFIAFFGLRGYVGWDWYNYTERYESIVPIFSPNFMDNFNLLTLTEPGFIILLSLVKQITESYLFLIFLLSFFSALIYKRLFEEYIGNVSFGFALLIAFGLNIQLDLIRNNISILMFLLSIKYLLNRNAKMYFLLNLIGMSFHLSSIFLFPLYFFAHRNLYRSLFILIFLGNLIYFSPIEVGPLVNQVSLIIGGDVNEKITNYSSMKEYSGRRLDLKIYFVKMATAIFFLFFYRILAAKNKNNIVFLNMVFFNILAFLFFSSFAVLYSRLQLLFVLAYCFALPPLLRTINYKMLIIPVFVFFHLFVMTQKYDVILFKYDNLITGILPLNKRQALFDQHAYIIKPLQ